MPNAIIEAVDAQNDFRATLGPITGKEPDSERRVLYHGTGVVAFWSATKGPGNGTQEVPMGGMIPVQCPENGATGMFPVVIDQTDMATAFSGLTDGTPVYLIGKAPGDFRVFREYVYREAIAAP